MNGPVGKPEGAGGSERLGLEHVHGGEGGMRWDWRDWQEHTEPWGPWYGAQGRFLTQGRTQSDNLVQCGETSRGKGGWEDQLGGHCLTAQCNQHTLMSSSLDFQVQGLLHDESHQEETPSGSLWQHSDFGLTRGQSYRRGFGYWSLMVPPNLQCPLQETRVLQMDHRIQCLRSNCWSKSDGSPEGAAKTIQ